jgi:hypothetical protein
MELEPIHLQNWYAIESTVGQGPSMIPSDLSSLIGVRPLRALQRISVLFEVLFDWKGVLFTAQKLPFPHCVYT